MRLRMLTFIIVAGMSLSACGQAGIGIDAATATMTPTIPSPNSTAPPQDTPTPLPERRSFEPEIYRDETLGFELSYPAAWDSPELFEAQSRGSVVQASMNGDVMMDIVTLQWDPKDDLEAYLDVREAAFEASGFAILSKDEISLEGDWRGVGYRIETATGDRAYFFFTTIGDQYLQLSGSGDLDQLAEIAASVRRLK